MSSTGPLCTRTAGRRNVIAFRGEGGVVFGTPEKNRLITRISAIAVACVAVSLMLLPPRPVSADNLADEAELAFQLGAECYRQGDYLCALQHFLRSNRLVPNRNVMFNIAKVFERLQRFPDAHRWYIDARAGETREATLAELDAALARIQPNVAIFDVTTNPPGAAVFVDRRDLGV